MLSPATVKVLSRIAGGVVVAMTLVIATLAVPGLVFAGIMSAAGAAAGGRRRDSSTSAPLLLFLGIPLVVLAAFVTVFMRFGWDLLSSQFIK
jgi:hypothetical protein